MILDVHAVPGVGIATFALLVFLQHNNSKTFGIATSIHSTFAHWDGRALCSSSGPVVSYCASTPPISSVNRPKLVFDHMMKMPVFVVGSCPFFLHDYRLRLEMQDWNKKVKSS